MSGIYIPGIETSGTCAFCRFCDGIADTQLGSCAYCVVDGKVREADTTPKDCPLVPVPDHGRLVGVLKTERECVSRNCDRDCGRCDLSLERNEILSVYDALLDMFADQTIIPADKEGEG